MTLQFSTTVRHARLDAVETAIGPSPILRLRTGGPPASCAAADTGTVVATMTLPADWMGDAASGQKLKAGVWQDLSADAGGIIGHYRIYDSGGSTCHAQGTVSEAGGGGDMILDNTDVNPGQSIALNSWTLTEPNG